MTDDVVLAYLVRAKAYVEVAVLEAERKRFLETP